MNNRTIYDILLSLSYANDKELKDNIVSILEESGLLDEIEVNALDVFIKKCMDLDGIPKPETLASFDVMYQNANKIIPTSIEDFTKIFISNKKKKNLQLALTDAALNIDLSNVSYADSSIKSYIDIAAKGYLNGTFPTVNAAVNYIKQQSQIELGLVVE